MAHAVSPDPAPEPKPTACEALAATLPPPGTELPAKTVLDVIAGLPGSNLQFAAKAPGGLTMDSSYGGTLNCQRNIVFRESNAVRGEIAIPERFAGGEGALCGDDKVQLVTIGGNAALVDSNGNSRPNRVTLDISLWNDSTWTPSCRLSIDTISHYGIREQFCRGDTCGALARMAVQMADARHASDESRQALAETAPPPADLDAWRRMMRLAESGHLIDEELPTFGQENTNGSLRSFVEWDTLLVPLVVDGRVLMGKIGTAGFGSHYGSDDLFAAYRLDGEHFEPVGGFYLSVAGRILSGAETGVSR